MSALFTLLDIVLAAIFLAWAWPLLYSLDRIAKADGRTTTSLTKKIIEDWLKAQGGKK